MQASHHPERIARVDALLVSINDRLGAFCRQMSCPSAGQDIAPMDTFYLDELIALAEAKARAQEEAIEEAKHGR